LFYFWVTRTQRKRALVNGSLVAGISLTLHTLSGNLLNPLLDNRASQILAGFGAYGGLLLGMPALLMVKVVHDRVDDFEPIGELLGKR
jgi:hypothetical protein